MNKAGIANRKLKIENQKAKRRKRPAFNGAIGG
jgi:hypothetical protein